MEIYKKINILFIFIILLNVLQICLGIYHSSEFTIDNQQYKNSDSFDLLLTLKVEKKHHSNTNNNIIINCFADSDEEVLFINKYDYINKGKINELFEFSGLIYYFIKFEKLKNFQKYKIHCSENSSSYIIKGQKQ